MQPEPVPTGAPGTAAGADSLEARDLIAAATLFPLGRLAALVAAAGIAPAAPLTPGSRPLADEHESR